MHNCVAFTKIKIESIYMGPKSSVAVNPLPKSPDPGKHCLSFCSYSLAFLEYAISVEFPLISKVSFAGFQFLVDSFLSLLAL